MAEMPSQPILPSVVQTVDEVVKEQQDALLHVLQPLHDRLGDAITWQQTALNGITGDIKKSVANRVKAQGKPLQAVADDMVSHLDNVVSEQQVRLNPLVAAAGASSNHWNLWHKSPNQCQCSPAGQPGPPGFTLISEFSDHGACQAAATYMCRGQQQQQQQTSDGSWDSSRKCWIGNPPANYPFAALGLPNPPSPVPFVSLGGPPENCGFPSAAWYGFNHQPTFALCLCETSIKPIGSPPPPIPQPITDLPEGCCPPAIINVPPCPTPPPPPPLHHAPCGPCVKCDDIAELPGYKVYHIPVDKKDAEDCYVESDCGTNYWQDKASEYFSAGSISDDLAANGWLSESVDESIDAASAQDQHDVEEDSLLDALESQVYQANNFYF